MLSICIMPARGGSVRIPKKNIVDVCGRPMIARAIEIAAATELFDAIVVSTESHEIAEVALRWGAEVVERPIELSQPDISTNTVFEFALQQYEKNRGVRYDAGMRMFPTHIFCPVAWIHDAFRALQKPCPGSSNSKKVSLVRGLTAAFPTIYRLSRAAVCHEPVVIPSKGIPLDIDTPGDLEAARQLIKLIEEGKLPNPLEDVEKS